MRISRTSAVPVGALMMGLVLLAGCAREPEPSVTVDVTPVLPDEGGPDDGTAPSTAEVPPPKVRPDIQPPAPKPATVVEPLDEVEVVGLNQPAVRDLLGQPSIVSADGPAELWRYRTEECDLGVYFYFDVEREGFYALQYDVADGGDNAEVKARACLEEIHRERQQF